jgi:hypothetical protein
MNTSIVAIFAGITLIGELNSLSFGIGSSEKPR